VLFRPESAGPEISGNEKKGKFYGQGDQIGRIFAKRQWFTLSGFLETKEIARIWALYY
jgi:hypothetical protein